MAKNNATVFVVDDDPAARDSVAAVVESMGIRVCGYSSAEAFIESYNDTPGCLVSDVRMYGMNGLQLLERMKSQQCDLPVILITAYGDVQLAVRALQHGAYTFLEKPCRNHVLWEAIHRCLEIDALNRRKNASRRTAQNRLSCLTSDERRMIDLIVEDKPNKALASAFGVSLRTIEVRRRALYKKLGVDSIATLMRLVIEADVATSE